MGALIGHRNFRLVEAARLHRTRARAQAGRTLIEGQHLLSAAIAAGHIPLVVFGLEDDRVTSETCSRDEIEFLAVDEIGLARLAGTKTPQGPVAVIDIPNAPSPMSRSMLVSWGVSDPGNVGTMIRTAAAFAWDFGYSPGTADPWSPKVLRSGAGSHFQTSLHQVTEIAAMREAGLKTVATVVAGGVSPAEMGDGPFAVLVGEEAHGLPEEVIAGCSVTVTVPMPGPTQSLNAAVAGALVVYALTHSAL